MISESRASVRVRSTAMATQIAYAILEIGIRDGGNGRRNVCNGRRDQGELDADCQENY